MTKILGTTRDSQVLADIERVNSYKYSLDLFSQMLHKAERKLWDDILTEFKIPKDFATSHRLCFSVKDGVGALTLEGEKDDGAIWVATHCRASPTGAHEFMEGTGICSFCEVGLVETGRFPK